MDTSKIEWFKCSNELPLDRMTPCLVFNGDAPIYNQHVFIACYFTQTNKFASDVDYLGTITHWAHLPKPPTE